MKITLEAEQGKCGQCPFFSITTEKGNHNDPSYEMAHCKLGCFQDSTGRYYQEALDPYELEENGFDKCDLEELNTNGKPTLKELLTYSEIDKQEIIDYFSNFHTDIWELWLEDMDNLPDYEKSLQDTIENMLDDLRFDVDNLSVLNDKFSERLSDYLWADYEQKMIKDSGAWNDFLKWGIQKSKNYSLTDRNKYFAKTIKKE